MGGRCGGGERGGGFYKGRLDGAGRSRTFMVAGDQGEVLLSCG